MEKQANTNATEHSVDDSVLDAMDGIYLGINHAMGLLGVLQEGLLDSSGDIVAVVPYSAENLVGTIQSINNLLAGASKNADILNKFRMAKFTAGKRTVQLVGALG